jgi:hypothetical protein
LYVISAELIENGIESGNLSSIFFQMEGYVGSNSDSNSNRAPKTAVYPKASPSDPSYDVSESSLRGAIYIPSTFTFGSKPPVILFAGTGSTGYETFVGNYIKLLSNVAYADPVWVNVPGFLLGDAQVNAVR